MHEGSVSVSGPVVGTKRTVSAGETLSISCLDGELALVNTRADMSRGTKSELAVPVAPDAMPLTQEPPAKPSAPPAPAGPDAPPLRAREAAPDPGALVPDFRVLARQHEYTRALEAAERGDFEALFLVLTSEELIAVGPYVELGCALRVVRWLTLRLDARAIMAFPRPIIQFADREVASLGRPLMTAPLGLEYRAVVSPTRD